ncbi:Rossmann-like and DUF2520 domain-containing protein [Pedobacter sp. PWIIR3]
MKIVFVGSGNVATHMAHAFYAQGQQILQVWSPNFQNSSKLASLVEAQVVSSIAGLDQHADLYIVAVKDDAIAEVVGNLNTVKGIVVHTSGTTDISILSSLKDYGVLYPLQTFSKSKSLEFKSIPLCIEASDERVINRLEKVASIISSAVFHMDSKKRRLLHLSAVFACNFVNHLYSLGNQLLEGSGIPFEILRPLILETALKVQDAFPEHVQTGPAIRRDQTTIAAHLQLLKDSPELAGIYQTLSDSIKKSNQ